MLVFSVVGPPSGGELGKAGGRLRRSKIHLRVRSRIDYASNEPQWQGLVDLHSFDHNGRDLLTSIRSTTMEGTC